MWIPFRCTRTSIHFYDSENPKKCRAIIFQDPLNDPTSTFYAENISGYIWRYGHSYPPIEIESKNLGVASGVGQRQADLGSELLLPGAAGDKQQWDEPATPHYLEVDEPVTDEDLTYIRAYTPTRIDLFQLMDMFGDYTFDHVEFFSRCRTESGGRFMRNRYKTYGTEYVGATNSVGIAYQNLIDVRATNPFTGVAWTLAEINLLQSGVEAILSANNARCTQVQLHVYYYLYSLYRGFISFDTSALPDDATVTVATLYLAIVSDLSTVDFDMHFYSGQDQWTNTATLDWTDCSVDEGVFFNTAGKALDTYYSHSVLTGSINLTGRTQFRFITDREGTKPTTDEYIILHAWNGTHPPYLVVDYTVPAPALKAGLHPSKPLAHILNG